VVIGGPRDDRAESERRSRELEAPLRVGERARGDRDGAAAAAEATLERHARALEGVLVTVADHSTPDRAPAGEAQLDRRRIERRDRVERVGGGVARRRRDDAARADGQSAHLEKPFGVVARYAAERGPLERSDAALRDDRGGGHRIAARVVDEAHAHHPASRESKEDIAGAGGR
jgi:hypothetical protein